MALYYFTAFSLNTRTDIMFRSQPLVTKAYKNSNKEKTMAFLNWEAKYEFGIPEMDKQHKKWLEILNKFYDQVSSGDIKEKMGAMVDEALQYTKFHFSEE